MNTELKRLVLTGGIYKDVPLQLEIWQDANHNVEELYVHPVNRKTLVGNVYVARVDHMAGNLKAAFLNLGNGLKAYLPLGKREPVYTLKHSKKEGLHEGDEIIVQIIRDGIKLKEATASERITFRGEYVLLEWNASGIGVSKKIEGNRRRDLNLLAQDALKDIEDRDFSITLRTVCESADDQAIRHDIARLVKQKEAFAKRAMHQQLYTCLMEHPPVWLDRVLRLPKEVYSEIQTDDPEIRGLFTSEEFDGTRVAAYANLVSEYKDDTYPLWKLAACDKLLDDVTGKKVWTKSGGFLIIEQTEALNVIDVNSGKVTHKKGQKDQALKMNLECAREAARQIRLRNLSGMILIDFINMEDPEDEKTLIKAMKDYTKNDPCHVTVLDITKLGLMELTRKKSGPSIHELIR